MALNAKIKRMLMLSSFIGLLSGFGPFGVPNFSTAASATAPLYINMQVHGNGGVYDVERQRFLVITPGYFVKSAKLYKLASGKTIYVFVDETGLQIYNAANGDHIRDLPFYQMPLLSKFNREHAELDFEAQVLEKAGTVEVSVLPASHSRAWRGFTQMPWLKLNLSTGKIDFGIS